MRNVAASQAAGAIAPAGRPEGQAGFGAYPQIGAALSQHPRLLQALMRGR
jgi:hypothetical protein